MRDELAEYRQDFTWLVEATMRQQENIRKAATTFNEIEPQFDALRSAIVQRATTQSAANEATQATMNTLVITGLVGIAATVVPLAGLTGRGIAHPVTAMTAAMKALAAGDTSIGIPGRGRKDEIGAMASAVVVFNDNMIQADRLAAKQTAERSAKERRQAAMDQHTQDFGTSISGVMAALASAAQGMRRAADAMSQAASAVHQQATGTASGAGQSSRELTTVVAATKQMTASIDEIARQVTAAAEVAREAVDQAETGQQASRLRFQVDQFLHAVRTDTGERRQYERLAGNGMMVKLKIQRRPAEQVTVRDMSRSGIAVGYKGEVPAGTEVQVTLPGDRTPLSGRVVRTMPDSMLAIMVCQDTATLGRVDQVMATLRTPRAA